MAIATISRMQAAIGITVALASTIGASAHAAPRTIEVVIEHFAFTPSSIEAAPGDTVVFINHDITPHTATAVDGSWTTKDITSGKSAKVVVPAHGAGVFLCLYHPIMRGRLVVTAARRGEQSHVSQNSRPQ